MRILVEKDDRRQREVWQGKGVAPHPSDLVGEAHASIRDTILCKGTWDDEGLPILLVFPGRV